MMNSEQFTRLVRRYIDTVFRVALNYLRNPSDAEDITQTVFEKLLREEKPFESEEHIRSWLIRVTVNESKDCLKSFFRRNTVSLEELRDYAPELDPDRYRVLEAVWALPKQYRDVIYLHYYEGYTAPEIAGLLNRNPNTVYTHLHKAKELLKSALGGDGDGE